VTVCGESKLLRDESDGVDDSWQIPDTVVYSVATTTQAVDAR
jgi:hypothetical protein